MKLKTTGRRIIDERDDGVYLWKMPNGQYIADDAGHFLSIASTKFNFARINALTNFVKNELGITEGGPHFLAGNRKVTDEEYEEQLQRQKFGLTPDPLDVAAIENERRINNVRK